MFARPERPQQLITLGAERKHLEVRKICYCLLSCGVKIWTVLGWASTRLGYAGTEMSPSVGRLSKPGSSVTLALVSITWQPGQANY